VRLTDLLSRSSVDALKLLSELTDSISADINRARGCEGYSYGLLSMMYLSVIYLQRDMPFSAEWLLTTEAPTSRSNGVKRSTAGSSSIYFIS
jgi:hypothetical protein